jgi:DNA-directed RNA polymerase specialized sigma24 family protein
MPLTRSPSNADDVLQEAILRAFRGFDALRGSGSGINSRDLRLIRE